MKRLLTLAAAALITGTVLTPGFAQDKMGKMQCAECAKMSKKAGKPSTLVLVEWIAVQKEIEFAFKDIPLP